jgi:chromosome partitioning protein
LLDEVLNDETLPEPSEYIITRELIDVIPCNISLSAFELNRGHEIGAERALKLVVESLREQYDVIIIDTPPTLGLLTINAITASDYVLIPVTPQLLSAVGLRMLVQTIRKVQRHINPQVEILGILMSMCDTRTNLYRQITEIVEQSYSRSLRIFDTVIPHSTKVGEANLHRRSVLLHAEYSKPAEAYRQLAREVIQYV